MKTGQTGQSFGCPQFNFSVTPREGAHKGLLLNCRRVLGTGSVVLLCCQVGFTTQGPLAPLPMETLPRFNELFILLAA